MTTKVKNPILTGFNPDPSILYANGYYYIAVSTFEYYRGVQIYRSRDLVNFEVIARPVDSARINMTANPESGGVWAPCLSYCDGTFFLIYSDIKIWAKGPFKDVSNYLITATDIEGEWSEPIYLNSSGFDPSLFHDTDGKKYLVNMEWDYRREGSDQFSGILIQEYDHSRKSLVGEVKKIFLGTDRASVEGPHIYKHDGYYFLFTAEGGTGVEHAETVARSRSLFGEYEVHPLKHIVTSYRTDNPLQKAGHASICQNDAGEWFMAHLCGRPLAGGRCTLGRETAIQNLDYRDGWFYIRGGGNQPRDFYEVQGRVEQKPFESGIIPFTQKNLKLKYQSLRTSLGDRLRVIDDTTVQLTGADSIYSLHNQSALLYRQQHHCFSAEVEVDFEPDSFMHLAGLMYRYNENNQYLLAVTKGEKGKALTLLCVNRGGFSKSAEVPLPEGASKLRLDVSYNSATFSYRTKDGYVAVFGEQDASILSDEYADPLGFTGAFVGMYAGDFLSHSKTAKFRGFSYEQKE